MMTSIHTQPVTASTLGDALLHHPTALPPVTCLDAMAVKHPHLLAVPRWRAAMVLLWCSLLLTIVYLQYTSLQVRSYIEVVAWGSVAFDIQTKASAGDANVRGAMASYGRQLGVASLPSSPNEHALLRQLAKQSPSNMQEQIIVAQHVVPDDSSRLRHRASIETQLKPRS